MAMKVDRATINSGRDLLANLLADKQNHPHLQKAVEVFNDRIKYFQSHYELWCQSTLGSTSSGILAAEGYDFTLHAWSGSSVTPSSASAKIIADIWVATSRELIDQLFPEKAKSEAVGQFYFTELLPANKTPEEFAETADLKTASDTSLKIKTFIDKMDRVAKGTMDIWIKTTAELEVAAQALAARKAYEKTDAYKIERLETEIAALETTIVPYPADNVLMQPAKVKEIHDILSKIPDSNLTQNQREKLLPGVLKALNNLQAGKVLKDDLAVLSPEGNNFFFTRFGCGDFEIVNASNELKMIVDTRNRLDETKSQLKQLKEKKDPVPAAQNPPNTVKTPDPIAKDEVKNPSNQAEVVTPKAQPSNPIDSATQAPIDPTKEPAKEPPSKPAVEPDVKQAEPEVIVSRKPESSVGQDEPKINQPPEVLKPTAPNKPVKKASVVVRFFRAIGDVFTSIGKWFAKVWSKIFGKKQQVSG